MQVTTSNLADGRRSRCLGVGVALLKHLCKFVNFGRHGFECLLSLHVAHSLSVQCYGAMLTFIWLLQICQAARDAVEDRGR